jgi:hypothetical protein
MANDPQVVVRVSTFTKRGLLNESWTNKNSVYRVAKLLSSTTKPSHALFAFCFSLFSFSLRPHTPLIKPVSSTTQTRQQDDPAALTTASNCSSNVTLFYWPSATGPNCCLLTRDALSRSIDHSLIVDTTERLITACPLSLVASGTDNSSKALQLLFGSRSVLSALFCFVVLLRSVCLTTTASTYALPSIQPSSLNSSWRS